MLAKVDEFLSSDELSLRLNTQWGNVHSGELQSFSTVTTHCARIYLLGNLVLKVKLSVKYSYIDLTSTSKRYACLKNELRINQPTLPDIYLCLVGIISNSGDQLELREEVWIDETDEVIEWCLLMRRFDEALVLDSLAESGNLTTEITDSLGNSIANYHRRAEQVIVGDGDIRIEEIIDELEDEFNRIDKNLRPAEALSYIALGRTACKNELKLLKKRGEQGYVRKCHGDLHLKNLLLHNNVPMPFDALEFNERLRTIDILYDLAFLLMDLDHRFLLLQENGVLNKYLASGDALDIRGIKLLPLFMYIRAGIKAMTSLQGVNTDPVNSESKLEESRLYLQCGRRYLNSRRPLIICVGGFSGSGKSTIARSLVNEVCQSPGAILVRSDVERKHLFGVEKTQSLGDSHYTAENAGAVYDRVFAKVESAAQAGYPVIVDAAFLEAAKRFEVQDLASKYGSEFYGFWLMAPVSVMMERLNTRTEDASDADVAVLNKQLTFKKGRITWQPVDTSSSIESVSQNIVSRLREHRESRAMPG